MAAPPALPRLRDVVGAALRRHRQRQGRTLRQVAVAAGVSLTYLSEIERGRKEASSEVLEAVCGALDLVLSELLFEVAEALARLEAAGGPLPAIGFIPARASTPPPGPVRVPVGVGTPAPASAPASARTPEPVATVLDFQAFAAAFAGRRSA
jgi:transcriptional regulator with XRE-family HTH domain